MVKFATSFVLGSALVARVAFAAPRPDSAVGDEVAVSAPNGTPITDTAELASQTAAEASMYGNSYYTTSAADAMYTSSSAVMYDSSSSSVDNYYSSSSVDNYYTYTTSSDGAMYTYTTSSADAMYTMDSSSMMDDSTSTMVYDSSYTTSTYDSMSTMVSYGSGSSSWGDSGYNDCVQQCVASFGSPMATYTPSVASSYESGSVGTGVTHTIIVAPSQGVLRYVPFATNASVGDTIQFMWNANMHTVTKSSELEICNKTTDAPFTSGVQNKSFTFTQVVNTTDPTFFYCGVPTHCQKGMFGIINPPSALTASTSVMSMMPSIANNNSDIAALAAYTQNLTSSSPVASTWGGSIDMANMPAWSYDVVAENVMYSRSFIAANPDIVQSDGSINLGASSAPLMIPQDLSNVLASSSSASSSPSSTGASSGSSTDSSTVSAASVTPTSGASGLTASMALSGVVALVATFYAL
ncbi:hypothetical protein M0805_009311 [Coniferiporia weirii]|nr:hypothetical protein M0805_009311 [Coniferiporia weirii]